MYPRIVINLNKYRHNLNFLNEHFARKNVSMTAVTKVFLADQRLVDVINQTDVQMIGDSRFENFKNMKTSKPKCLLRIPPISRVDEVCMYTDISLQSEIEVIKALNQVAEQMNKKHQIILMFDLGDLREGIYYNSDYIDIIAQILKLEYIELKGIGANLTCFGGVVPTQDTLLKLIQIKDKIESHFNFKLDIISGGNSSSIELLLNGEQPSEINHLRIGEALVLGRETAYGHIINGMHDDVFTLEAEVIELKTKPSLPEGILGMDAFGHQVNFVDLGLMNRAILAVGRQDCDPADLIPPKGVEVLGGSSDHLIVNLKTDQYKIGDVIQFKLTYGSLLRLMTSPYVRRVYVDL
jgi:ornithine racemase